MIRGGYLRKHILKKNMLQKNFKIQTHSLLGYYTHFQDTLKHSNIGSRKPPGEDVTSHVYAGSKHRKHAGQRLNGRADTRASNIPPLVTVTANAAVEVSPRKPVTGSLGFLCWLPVHTSCP